MVALTTGDRDVIEASVRRSASYAAPPIPPAQVDAAVALALELYAVAAHHGIDRGSADGVTSFVHAALDGVRARDHRRQSPTAASVSS
ncbi:hypothetical protein JOE61_002531 [Nocardioides salarius]|uniref:Tetracyclin repressor-like C-terminal domain-containing protein n=1 Tax=Nocardioides salarius TaxID=374513 RepID=A0ABS2MC09_9ACTN|nr:hypothetical protein [Nocardioides salarius]MBM7508717.1 hypothetical protein [Nocardioides salarius]